MSAEKIAAVTGAGGSIGSLLTRALCAEGYTVRAVSRSEYSMHKLLASLPRDADIEPVIGNILDGDTRRRALAGAQLVYHTAAHKHVRYCEENRIEAVRNNVLGTLLLAETAIWAGVPEFIQLSTDKAVNPTTIMGLTKRVCELMMFNYTAGIVDPETRFHVARLCNVMGTAGSVTEIWAKQRAAMQPVTVVENMWRYFIEPAHATQFLLNVRGMESFVAPLVYLPAGLEERSVEELARSLGDGAAQAIRYIPGLPSEKDHEALCYGDYSNLGYPVRGIVSDVEEIPQNFKENVEYLLRTLVQADEPGIREALQKATSYVTLLH